MLGCYRDTKSTIAAGQPKLHPADPKVQAQIRQSVEKILSE
jgi:hypothetical protein